MKTLAILPNDPIYRYYEKGEIKPRYFNPCNYFDEIHIISLTNADIEPEKVQMIAGKARLYIHTVAIPSLFSLFSLRERVYKIIKDIMPQCIRAYNPLLMGWYAVYSGRRLGIPTVISVHDDFSIWRRRKTYGKGYWLRAAYQIAYRLFFEKYTFKYADRIICAYNFVRRYVEHFRKGDIEVIYNRVDLSRFKPGKSTQNFDETGVTNQDKAPLKVISVGRQFKGKDPTPILQAIKDLNVELTLIGKGPLNQSLRRLAAQLQLTHQVSFLDSVPNEQLPNYYANHDMFAISIVQPGVCMPVLEAMASGLPIVINQPIWEENPEVVGELAMQVEKTSQGYRQAFQTLLNNSELRRKLGKQVRERALQYNGCIMEEKEKNVYRTLVECS